MTLNFRSGLTGSLDNQSRYLNKQSQNRSGLFTTETNLSGAPLSKLSGSSFTRNDDLDDAEDLGKLRRGDTIDESGEVDDDESVLFRFKLKKTNEFRLRLTNEENADETIQAFVLDDEGDRLRKFKVKSDQSKTFSFRNLSGKTFYLRLKTDGNQVDYDFELSAPES